MSAENTTEQVKIKGVGCDALVQPLLKGDEEEEWHIESDWNRRIAICGCDLKRGDGIPSEEVPDSETCEKCLSVEKSIVYRFLKSPAMKCKVWLVG